MAILRFYAPEILDGHDSTNATFCEPVAPAQVREEVILSLSVSGVPLGYIETGIATRTRLTRSRRSIARHMIGTHAMRTARRSEREKQHLTLTESHQPLVRNLFDFPPIDGSAELALPTRARTTTHRPMSAALHTPELRRILAPPNTIGADFARTGDTLPRMHPATARTVPDIRHGALTTLSLGYSIRSHGARQSLQHPFAYT